MRNAMVLGSVLLAAALAFGQVFYSENVTAGAAGSAVPTLANFRSAKSVLITASAANASYVRYSPDLLADGDFEDSVQADSADPFRGAGSVDAWDEDDNLLTWGYLENTVTIEPETTNELYGVSSLRFDAGSLSQLIANEDFELATADDFDDWTEDVNSGTGTIESDEVDPYDGDIDAKLTGGDQHVDLTSAEVTVTADTEYVLSVWGHVDNADDQCDIRVVESTGGSDFLQTDGTWDTGEVDFCEATFDDSTSAYQQCVVEFTTDTGITGIQVSAHADVTGDICFIDGFSLHAKPTTQIQDTTTQKIYDDTADSYVLEFTQQAAVANGSARVEYAIIDPNDNSTRYYYTGTAWSTTETWISSSYSSSSTRVRAYFEARTTDGHYVQVRIRPETMGEDEDIYLDKVFLVATARVGKGILLGTTPVEVGTLTQGRFTVIDDGSSTVVNFAAQR